MTDIRGVAPKYAPLRAKKQAGTTWRTAHAQGKVSERPAVPVRDAAGDVDVAGQVRQRRPAREATGQLAAGGPLTAQVLLIRD